MDVFSEIHKGLPQEGPGSEAATRKALSSVGRLPARSRILDVGCGPGRQTLLLARETGGEITAVDTHQPYLDELQRRATKEGVVLCADGETDLEATQTVRERPVCDRCAEGRATRNRSLSPVLRFVRIRFFIMRKTGVN